MVVITGGTGFLGKYVAAALAAKGVATKCLGTSDGDLRDRETAVALLRNSEVVIHLAADVGGVGYLRSQASKVFHSNLQLGLNVIEAARSAKARRIIVAGTPCSYAADAELPLRESMLSFGVPSGDTGTYGCAKLVTSLAATSAGRSCGMDAVTIVPSNLYGPGDCYDAKSSHVVAALIRKAVVARVFGAKYFEVWGDGSASRDLVYVEDVAATIAEVAISTRRFDGAIFNLGSNRETTIAELSHEIARAVGNEVQPKFLPEMPVGYSRRMMSIERAAAELNYQPRTSLFDGLRKSIEAVYASGQVRGWMPSEALRDVTAKAE